MQVPLAKAELIQALQQAQTPDDRAAAAAALAEHVSKLRKRKAAASCADVSSCVAAAKAQPLASCPLPFASDLPAPSSFFVVLPLLSAAELLS